MIWNPKWFPGTNLQDLNLDWILKKIAALRGGTAGQYLYKKSDKDFDFGWKTGSGGGGGTSDYLDLDNKPSINNVELTGNKTASDLGLATPSDIPVVPVQSVNGKTGAVVLSASDVGAYVKPEEGIPKTDLSSAVQTSLDKADTALQAVPPTYRAAAAQDVIDAAQNAQIDACAKANEIAVLIMGARPSIAVTAGQYVIVRNSTISGITDGLYTANAALSPSTDVTAANLMAVSKGGFNALKNLFTIETLNYSDFNTTNFAFESWGNIYVTKCGPIVLVGVSGLKANTAITNNTMLCRLPITAKSAALVTMVNDAQMFIQLNHNDLQINKMTQGGTTSGQIAILTDF